MIPFKTIRVGPFDVAIEKLRAEERDECLGQFSRIAMSIEMRDQYINPQQEAETLLHEILHVIWYVMGIQGKKEYEEKTVNQMSVGLASVIRDNPELMQWLRKKLS